MSPTPIRVLIYEDNRDFRDGLGYLLGATPGLELAGARPNCLDASADTRQLRPQVVLMDIDMPGRSGIDGTRAVKQADPAVSVLMLTMFEDDQHIWQAVRAGASGYLLKSTPPTQIIEAVRDAVTGGAPMSGAVARQVLQMLSSRDAPALMSAADGPALTATEREILALLVKGNSYKMIVADQGITIATVRAHVQAVYQKVHVRSVPETGAHL